MYKRLLKKYILIIIIIIHCDNKTVIKVAMSEGSTTFKHVVQLSYHYNRFEEPK